MLLTILVKTHEIVDEGVNTRLQLGFVLEVYFFFLRVQFSDLVLLGLGRRGAFPGCRWERERAPIIFLNSAS